MIEYHVTFKCGRCGLTKVVEYLDKPKTVRNRPCVYCVPGKMKPIFPIREIETRKES